MRSPAQQAKSLAKGGEGWGNSALAASVVSEEEADQMLGDSWVTLVCDNTQAPGKPVGHLHRILCHESDLESMEQLARANGYQVRAEALRRDEA